MNELKQEQKRFAVIIAGSRTFNNYELLRKKCDLYFRDRKPTAIICGEAKGADTLGKRYAEENDIPVLSFPADWKKHGKMAGILRNEDMGRNAEALIAFWDGESRGTANMIQVAKNLGIPFRVVRFDKEGFEAFVE